MACLHSVATTTPVSHGRCRRAVGSAVGLTGASLMTAVDISTTDFPTFAELAFSLVLTPSIAAQSFVFTLAMGLAGGFVPAWRVARPAIVDSLRVA